MDRNLMAFLGGLVGSSAGVLFAWLAVTAGFWIKDRREYRRLRRQFLKAYEAAKKRPQERYLLLEPEITTPREEEQA